MGVQHVDWQTADTYSLGLVIASVWGRPPIWSLYRLSNSCFLDRFIPQALTQTERRDRLVVMKTHGDAHPLSVMQMSWTNEGLINPVFVGTLAASPVNRVTTAILAATVIPGLAALVRRERTTSRAPSPPVDRGITKFKVWKFEYLSQSNPNFHDLVFKHLSRDSDPVYSLLDLEPGAIPELYPEGGDSRDIIQQALSALKTLQAMAERRRGKNVWDLGRLAFHVSISHCLGLGTVPDEEVMTRSLVASALAGYDSAIYMAPLVTRAPLSQRELSARLKPLCLTLCAVVGMKSSLDVLQREYPELYHATVRALWTRRGTPRGSTRGSIKDYVESIASSPIKDSESFSLIEALKYHNAVSARQLLEQEGYDASELDEAGLGAFQALVFLQDEDAAWLAPLCLRRGANLGHQAQAPASLCLLQSLVPRSGSALAWAWAFHMPKYFQTLLRLHAENSIIVSDFRLLLLHCANNCKPLFLQQLLQVRASTPTVVDAVFSSDIGAIIEQYRHIAGISAQDFHDSMHQIQTMPLSDLLRHCLWVSTIDQGGEGLSVVSRRIYHASAEEQERAEAETLRILLRETGEILAALSCVSENANPWRLETMCDFIADSNTADVYMETLSLLFPSQSREQIWKRPRPSPSALVKSSDGKHSACKKVKTEP